MPFSRGSSQPRSSALQANSLPAVNRRSDLTSSIQFSSVAQLSLTVTPWTAARQASLTITNSWSLLKLMCIESLMPSNYLILCHPLLLRPSVFPSIRVFSNESVLRIRWPKYWSFSFNISPSNESDLTSYFRPNRNLVLELAPPYTDRLVSSCCQDRPVILRQPLLTD